MTQEKRRLKIVQIIGGMHFGGAERVVANLSGRLDPCRFDVSISVVKFRGAMADELEHGGRMIVGPAIEGGGGPVRGAKASKRLIDELDPDIIHTHGTIALLNTAPWYAITPRPPWVHTFHFGNYPHIKSRYRWLERIAVRLPRRLVAVSNEQRRTIIHTHWVREKKVQTILNGVEDDPYIHNSDTGLEVRAELRIPIEAPVVGAVAVLSRQKGLKYLLGAMTRVLESHPNTRLVIVGRGPMESELRRNIASAGIDGSVIMTGWRKDARRVMKSFDIFALPSLWEGLPIVLLEAMAAGLPTVCTAVGDNAHVIKDGESGLVVPAADSGALTSALLRLLDDPLAAHNMGSNARRAYLARYDVDHMVEGYKKVYSDLYGSIRDPGAKAKRRSALD